MNKVMKYLKNPGMFLVILDNKGIVRISDKRYLDILFKTVFGRHINWENPRTYNEKLQWLKLNDHKEIYKIIVDKIAVKDYVAKRIGKQYVIPTIGIYDNFDEIDFSKLPNQFVIKCNHDSGGLAICLDKKTFNKEEARRKIEKSLRTNYYYVSREWPYKDVRPRILIEEYLEDRDDKELRDYKFFCFDGKAKMLFVTAGRQTKGEEATFDFFDLDYNHLDIKSGHPNAEIVPHKPRNFKKMIQLAEKLAEGFTHVRVDLYEVNGKVYFGEMTLYRAGGLTPFEPEEWDYKLGELICLPEKK